MVNLNKSISDRTMLIWLIVSALSTIVCLIGTAIVVYFLQDCWIFFQHQLAGGNCMNRINVPVVFSIPVVLGVIIGSIATRKIA